MLQLPISHVLVDHCLKDNYFYRAVTNTSAIYFFYF
nr:MAG TPA: hypothetical protein [Caudoviricetes sp.]